MNDLIKAKSVCVFKTWKTLARIDQQRRGEKIYRTTFFHTQIFLFDLFRQNKLEVTIWLLNSTWYFFLPTFLDTNVRKAKNFICFFMRRSIELNITWGGGWGKKKTKFNAYYVYPMKIVSHTHHEAHIWETLAKKMFGMSLFYMLWDSP